MSKISLKKILAILGSLLFAFGIIGVLVLMYPKSLTNPVVENSSETIAAEATTTVSASGAELPAADSPENNQGEAASPKSKSPVSPSPKKTTPVFTADSSFGISIPALGLSENIVKNVDPSDYNAYQEALKLGVAHAAGTYLPGEGGNIFLFAHSSSRPGKKDKVVFDDISDLNTGDVVTVNYKNHGHTYKVTDKKIVAATDVQYLSPNPGKEVLILMTCWPKFTNLKRILVFAEPVN